MSAKITLEELTNAARSVKHAATKGQRPLFDSNADYLRSMVEAFIRQESEVLEKNL